jgi:nicotinamidase-related amidase
MKLNPEKTAVLSLDVQNGIIAMVAATQIALPAISQVVGAARKAGCFLAHVGIGFEPGYPEISPAHPRFSMLKEKKLFIKGSESAQIYAPILQPDDLVIYKHRVSGFAGNSLQMILQAKGITTLVLFGFATSGIVLSTLRQASDLDYQCIVIKDACADGDEEVHRVLTEKVFANQATVITAQQFQAECLGV